MTKTGDALPEGYIMVPKEAWDELVQKEGILDKIKEIHADPIYDEIDRDCYIDELLQEAP